MNIGAWNIRGLNKSIKQTEVIEVIKGNNLRLCAILESHVKDKKLVRVCSKVFGNWEWVFNNSSCNSGARIIVGWNTNVLDVMVLSHSFQVMHCLIRFLETNCEFYISFVYAASQYIERRILWENLGKHRIVVDDKAWALLGDFNVAMKLSEYSMSSSKIPVGVSDFLDCINLIEVEDINYSSLQFTWTKSPNGVNGLLKKLDRVMANLKFLEVFPLAHAIFKPYRISDHSPAILSLPLKMTRRIHLFKFVNYIVDKK